MALGRGLKSLIPEDLIINENDSEDKFTFLNIESLKPNPNQPRKTFDLEKLNELAISIKNHGILEPIIVKKIDQDYIIIAGERRWRAATIAELSKVPVIIKSEFDQELELMIIENLQREDLNVIELANGYQTLIDIYNYTHKDLADKLGVTRSTVTNTLRLLKLPDSIKDLLEKKIISFGIARSLINIEDEELQLLIAQEAIEKKLSVRDVEKLIKKYKKPPSVKIKKKEDPYILELETNLSDLLGSKVSIKNNNKKGKIEINYNSIDELNKIIKIFGLKETI